MSGIRIEANVGHDTSVGRARESQVNADSGNDVVQINGCANDVVAGTGNDRYENPAACRGARRGSVSMGNGNDTVLLCYADQVNLGNGHDVLRAVRTIDVIRAGSGDDDVEFSLAVTTELFLGPGIDLLRLGGSTGVAVHAGNGADRVSGRALDSTIGGDDGSDLIELAALSARNALDGGPGRDHARLHRTSLATTCGRIERVTDPADKPRACA